MIDSDKLKKMDTAFTNYGTDVKVGPNDQIVIAAMMMCKFMAFNDFSMRRSGIPGTLMEECYKAIESSK